MAENNQGNSGFDLFGGMRKLFSLLDRAFIIMDKQYAIDGSFKYDWAVDKNKSVVITVKGIPSRERGLYDIQFSTNAATLEGTENPYVKRGVNMGEIPDILTSIKHMWFGDKYDTKPAQQQENNTQDTGRQDSKDKENKKEGSMQQSKQRQRQMKQDTPSRDPSLDGMYNRFHGASKVLKFGVSKIEGSHELQLTKVYANYNTDLALTDLNTVFDEFNFNDYDDTCFYEVCPENTELCVYESQDFSVDYCSILDGMLGRLYEIYIREKVYHKMFSDLELQVFFKIDPTIDNMIDYLQDIRFDICSTLQDPTNYMFSDCAYGDDTASNQLCYCYIGNLTEVQNSIQLFMCNFDSETQAVLQSYQNQIQSYLDELQELGFYFPEEIGSVDTLYDDGFDDAEFFDDPFSNSEHVDSDFTDSDSIETVDDELY